MIWIALVLASLLSVCGQLCQKQATRPVSVRARKRHVTQWIGLALTSLGLAMLLWLAVLQNIPVGIAYPMLSLNFCMGDAGRVENLARTRHYTPLAGVGLIITGIFILGSAV